MFNNPFSMVVAIVAIVSIASIIRARYGLSRHRGDRHGRRNVHEAGSLDTLENQRLRDEVKALKDRVAVLERLATDGNSALEREFEKLRQQQD